MASNAADHDATPRGSSRWAQCWSSCRAYAGDRCRRWPTSDIIDDGSAASGEVMNLMVRDNLLFRLVSAPDRRLKVNVKLGTKEYPMEDAKNPGTVAHLVRANLGDEKRSLRVYGSQVVVARLTAANGKASAAPVELRGRESESGWDSRAGTRRIFRSTELRVAGHRGSSFIDYSVEQRRHRVYASGVEDFCGDRSVDGDRML